jgi:hypothetical protein
VALQGHTLGVRTQHRHAHASHVDTQPRQLEDLARLALHLELFARATLFVEDVDLRHDVEGQLVPEVCLGIARRLGAVLTRSEELPQIGHEGVHRLLSCAGRRLIRRRDDPPEPEARVDRRQGLHEQDGRAVGIGDQRIPLTRQEGLERRGVALGHDERHAFVHAKGRAVVDDEGPAAQRVRRELARAPRATGEEGQVDAFERLGPQLLHDADLAADVQLTAGRALARQQTQLRVGELSLDEQLEELPPHGPGRPYDRDPRSRGHAPRSSAARHASGSVVDRSPSAR